MFAVKKKAVAVFLVVLAVSGTAMLIHHWNSYTITTIDVLQGPDSLKVILEEKIKNMEHKNDHIPYHVKESLSK